MTKAEIVQAAFKVWGREFYQQTSLSALARELGVSKPALYRHFASKQALVAAMMEHFFDDFAACIKPDHERAISGADQKADIFIMIRSVIGYYARNVYALVFSLVNVYDRDSRRSFQGRGKFAVGEQLKSRGVDMDLFHQAVQKEYETDPLLMLLMFTTLSFFMAHFHKTGKSFGDPPAEESIQHIITVISEIIAGGLGYKNEQVNALNFENLESHASAAVQQVEDDPLLRAVAQAVAEVGPWEASMDMIAHRSGLSKSSLYGHFKSKLDMLRQLFRTEFIRILTFARQGMGTSELAEEKLYLGIFSIAVYLRSRPDILIALDWMRTRRLDLGKSEEEPDFFRLFEDIETGALPGGNGGEDEKQQISHWILFLLVNILMSRKDGQALGSVQNRDIRTLYRFVTMGMKGFKRS